MPPGLPGGDTRPAIRLYHEKYPDGHTFRPIPDTDRLVKMGRAGWVDTPAKLPGYVPPESSIPGFGDHDPVLTAAATTPPPKAAVVEGPREPAIDIRTIPAAEAVAIVGKITDGVVLRKIHQREKSTLKPKGGRRAVLDALADRMADLLG